MGIDPACNHKYLDGRVPSRDIKGNKIASSTYFNLQPNLLIFILINHRNSYRGFSLSWAKILLKSSIFIINTNLHLPQIDVKYFNIYNRAKKYKHNAQYVFPCTIKNFSSFQMQPLIFYLIIMQNKIYVKLY